MDPLEIHTFSFTYFDESKNVQELQHSVKDKFPVLSCVLMFPCFPAYTPRYSWITNGSLNVESHVHDSTAPLPLAPTQIYCKR